MSQPRQANTQNMRHVFPAPPRSPTLPILNAPGPSSRVAHDTAHAKAPPTRLLSRDVSNRKSMAGEAQEKGTLRAISLNVPFRKVNTLAEQTARSAAWRCIIFVSAFGCTALMQGPNVGLAAAFALAATRLLVRCECHLARLCMQRW